MLREVLLSTVLASCISTLHAGESHYATTPPNVVVAMLDSVSVTSSDTVVDLGCGDGRIPIIAAARYGVKAVGVEHDTSIAAIARENVARNGVGHLASIQSGDVLHMRWNSSQKVVTVYLDSELLTKLRPILEKLPVGSRIVSHQHPIPGWKQGKVIKIQEHKLYRYRVTEVSRKVKVCGPNGCTYKNVTHKIVRGY